MTPRPGLYVSALRLAYRLGSLFPIRERVVLATSHKPSIDGNLAVINDYLQARLPRHRVRVLAYQVPPVSRRALRRALQELRAEFILATSRVFVVDDYFFPLYPIQLRPGTTVIQTWHACGAFKKFGLSLTQDDHQGRSKIRIHSNYSVCLASSRPAAEAFSEAFGQPLELFNWDLGIPRTDPLVATKPERIQAIRDALGLRDDRRVILYAPTYRGSGSTDAHSSEMLDLTLLARELGSDYVVLVRAHPFVADRLAVDAELADFAKDVFDWPDINDLMLVSDVLVTDYSSVVFDFSLLGRPTVFFTPDHAKFERERGFYFDYRSDGPGPAFDTTAEVAAYLRRGVFDLEHVARFATHWFTVADGCATQRFADELVLPRLGATSGLAAPRRGTTQA